MTPLRRLDQTGSGLLFRESIDFNVLYREQ